MALHGGHEGCGAGDRRLLKGGLAMGEAKQRRTAKRGRRGQEPRWLKVTRRRDPWQNRTIDAMARSSPKRRIFALGIGRHVVPPHTRLNVTMFSTVDFVVERLFVPCSHSQVMVNGVTVAGKNILRSFFPVPAIVFSEGVAQNFLWPGFKRKNVARSSDRICISVENDTGRPQSFTGAFIGPEL